MARWMGKARVGRATVFKIQISQSHDCFLAYWGFKLDVPDSNRFILLKSSKVPQKRMCFGNSIKNKEK